jgi:hypothetical protein
VALVVALCLTWQAVTLFHRDLVFTAAATEVGFWGRGDYQPAQATRARIGLSIDTLLAGSPAHPDHLALAASYYAWQAYWAQAAEREEAYNLRAFTAQYTAQQNRPAYRQGWATMLGYAARVETGSQAQRVARRQLSLLAAPDAPGPASALAR